MKDLFKSEIINDHMKRIHLPGNVFAYYIEGTERGLLIDTGYGYGDLKKYVDEISTKPYEVALTHGHVDHAGGAVQFDRVYLNESDFPVAEEHTVVEYRAKNLEWIYPDMIEDQLLPEKPVAEYLPMENGKEFDLGGVTVQFLSLKGHTPGSMVAFIPEFQTMLFGDALNSVTFMQLPESSPIEEYRDTLIRFNRTYAGKYEHILFSHDQSICRPELVNEMLEVCDEMINDTFESCDVSDIMGDGLKLAKPVDKRTFRRLDGKTANILYRS